MPTARSASSGVGGDPTNTAAVACTLPTGWQAGDIVLFAFAIRNTIAGGTWTPTPGGGVWTQEFSTNNTGDASGGQYGVFSRLMTGGEANPTFTYNDTGKWAWVGICVRPDSAGTLSFNGTAASSLDTTAGTSIAFPSRTASGGATGLTSVIVGVMSSTVSVATAIDPAPPTNWAVPTNGEVSTINGTTQARRQIACLAATRDSQSGTISPAALTWTQSGGGNGLGCGYHFLIEETAGGATDLVVANAAHAHTAASPTLTQVHELVVAKATQATTSTTPTLTQVHELVVANAAHGHTAGSPALVVDLAVANASHAHTSTAPVLTQVHSLTVGNAAHGHTAGSPTLTQTHVLTVAKATQAHTAGSPTLTQVHELTVANSHHAHTATSPTLDGSGDLAPANAVHALSSTSPTLTQVHNLAAANSLHTLTSTAPALTQVHQLAVAGAAHAHTATSPALTQVHFLAVAGAVHAHTAQNVALGMGSEQPASATAQVTARRIATSSITALRVDDPSVAARRTVAAAAAADHTQTSGVS